MLEIRLQTGKVESLQKSCVAAREVSVWDRIGGHAQRVMQSTQQRAERPYIKISKVGGTHFDCGRSMSSRKQPSAAKSWGAINCLEDVVVRVLAEVVVVGAGGWAVTTKIEPNETRIQLN